jgi:hypothetical protein
MLANDFPRARMRARDLPFAIYSRAEEEAGINHDR